MVRPRKPTVLNGVRYRLQSVEYDRYLERRDVYLLLRPLKKKSNAQQWTLKVSSDPETYELHDIDISNQNWVLNAEAKGSILTQEKARTATGKQFIFYNAPVDDESDDQVYIISANLGDGNNTFAYARNEDEAGVDTDSNLGPKTDISTEKKDDNYKWRLLEVDAACLPEGNEGRFRIRTFNGIVIHSVPNSNSLSTKSQALSDQCAWTIQDLGNGRVILYNVAKQKYLDAKKDSSGLWEPVFADSPPATDGWIIRPTTDLTWSITIKRVTERDGSSSPEQLSLSLDGDKVELKPVKHAHNQIWLIEPTGAPLPINPNDDDDDDDNDNGDHPELLPHSNLLGNRDYEIHDNSHAYAMQVRLDNVRGMYSVQLTYWSGAGGSPSVFTLEKAPSGQPGDIVIYYKFDGNKYYLALNGTFVTVTPNVSHVWRLEPGTTDPLRFKIRDPSSGLAMYSADVIDAPITVAQSPSGNVDGWVLWDLELVP